MSYLEARYRGDQDEVSTTAVRYLATGATTQGQFGLYRWDARPHMPGPSAHFHGTMSESFFILSGTASNSR